MNKRIRAFGLIGILALRFIIGALGGMLVVGVMMQRDAGLTARTCIQFIQYESALKAYCREYGEMPLFITPEEAFWLNRDGNSALLIKALSDRNPDGSQLSRRDMEYLNPFGKRFYTFTDGDFFKRKDGSIDRSQVADAFNNTSRCIALESVFDDDTVIPKSVLPKVIQRQIIGNLVNAQIAIFSVDEEQETIISSWSKE